MAGEAVVDPPHEPRGRLLSRSLAPLMLSLGLVQMCIAGLIGWTIYVERHTRTVGRRETNALLAVNQLVEAALDAETGQRGYLLTGRTLYLQPYLTSKARMVQCERRLSSLLAGDDKPDVGPHLAALERGVDRKIAELDETIALSRAGKRDEALKLVNTDLGKQQMDAIRGEAHWLSDTAAARRRTFAARISAIEGWSLVLVVLFGLGSLALVLIGLQSEGNRARAAAEADQAAALREANDRAQLLTRELNHRVKNFFAIVMAIVSLSGRKRGGTSDVVEDIRSRIHALSQAHEVSQGQLGSAGVTINELIRRIAAPYIDPKENRLTLTGPSQPLPPRMVTPLGLIFHELATNAVKYGALSNEAGRVEVNWQLLPIGDTYVELCVEWIESGGPALNIGAQSAAPTGFGSRMIELAVRQLGGQIERGWPDTGLVVRLASPLR